MLSDVMTYFGLKRTLDHVGYFETEDQKNLFKELKLQIRQSCLIAITGVVGCGKTTTLQRLKKELANEKDIVISHSLAVDKDKVNLGVLMTALFCDLSTEKNGWVFTCKNPAALSFQLRLTSSTRLRRTLR